MAQDNAFVKLWQSEEQRALRDLQTSDDSFKTESHDFRFIKKVMETRRELVKSSRAHIRHEDLGKAIDEADEATGAIAAE